jgi:hypothetical protein
MSAAPYAERAYFDGDHCAHVAAYEDHLAILRLERQWGRAVQARGSRGSIAA